MTRSSPWPFVATSFVLTLSAMVPAGQAQAEPLSAEAYSYYGCLFAEALRDNAAISAGAITGAQRKCSEEAFAYGVVVAKEAGSIPTAARHNSRKFVQKYLSDQVPAALQKAGLVP